MKRPRVSNHIQEGGHNKEWLAEDDEWIGGTRHISN
jgi:hypothetical protein